MGLTISERFWLILLLLILVRACKAGRVFVPSFASVPDILRVKTWRTGRMKVRVGRNKAITKDMRRVEERKDGRDSIHPRRGITAVHMQLPCFLGAPKNPPHTTALQ